MTALQAIVHEIFNTRVHWESDILGWVRCPGHERHTTPGSHKDCRVTLDGVPTIYCFHASCQEVIANANFYLRNVINERLPKTEAEINAMVASRDRARNRKELAARASAWLPTILKNFTWELPNMPHLTPDQMRRMCLALFNPCDTVWIGDIAHSGLHFKHHFKHPDEWFKCVEPAWRYITPCAYLPETFHRSRTQVLHPRFLVVESDTLSKPETLAIFRWLNRGALRDKLCMVVDTGGKSLHGWFQHPKDFGKPELLDELEVALPALGCDPKLFNPAQPVRMPGMLRNNGNLQTILYYA